MPRNRWDESFKLDYACDAARNYLMTFISSGAQFCTTDRYQIMYLDGIVTELNRVSDTLKAIEIHLGLKNLWCDRRIAENLWVKARQHCQPLPESIRNEVNCNTHPYGLTKQMKLRIKQVIESKVLSQPLGE